MKIRLTVPKGKDSWPSVRVGKAWYIFVNRTDRALRELLEPGAYAVSISKKPGFRCLAALYRRATEESMYVYKSVKDPQIKLAFCKNIFDTVFSTPPSNLYIRRIPKPKQGDAT